MTLVFPKCTGTLRPKVVKLSDQFDMTSLIRGGRLTWVEGVAMRRNCGLLLLMAAAVECFQLPGSGQGI